MTEWGAVVLLEEHTSIEVKVFVILLEEHTSCERSRIPFALLRVL
jgi:hypothetical protein